MISKYASPPKYAKAPSRLFYLAKEAELLGNKVLIITSDANHFSNFPETNHTYNDEKFESVDVRWVKTKKYKKTASFSRILSWFDFERKLFCMPLKKMVKPDVVIVSSLSILSIVYGYYLKKKFNSFLVFEIRDIWPLTMTEEGGFSKWHPLVVFIGLIEKFGYKRADLIVGTMPKLNLHVKKILGYERPFYCLPIGFYPSNYELETNSNKSLFQDVFPESKVIVGYVGSMGITNALDLFIDTIKLMKDNDKIHFLLVGSGDLKESFEKELTGYSNVTFNPRICHNDVKNFLDRCDILYLSTQNSKVWEFGQSMNKVVEYMLAGKPIIATYSGYPSMINEADCGRFVNTNDPKELEKIFLYYTSMTKEERELIGLRGRKWIYENRVYSNLAKDYLQTISKMMDIKIKK